MGNPEYFKYAKNQTGPVTPEGKLIVSMNPIKRISKNQQRDQFNKLALSRKLMEEAGVDFSKVKSALKKRNLFEIWIRKHNGKELSQITKLNQVIELLEADMNVRVMPRLEKGIPLGPCDVKLIRLLKECLESSHKMEFGEKKVNINASYKDIRDMMFPEENRPMEKKENE